MYQCYAFVVCGSWHFLFAIRMFSYQKSYTYFLLSLFWSHQSILVSRYCCRKTEYIVIKQFQNIKSNTMVSTLLFIYYVWIQKVYCISVVPVQLVGYFISYSRSEPFSYQNSYSSFLVYIVFVDSIIPCLSSKFLKSIINIVWTIQLFYINVLKKNILQR